MLRSQLALTFFVTTSEMTFVSYYENKSNYCVHLAVKITNTNSY